MDSVTQIVLGAATAELIAGKKLGNRAILYGAILGTIPDLDTFVGMQYDIVTANELHRGFSHSIVFFILATPVLGTLIRWLERRNSLTWRESSAMTFFCLLTHALLDAFTNWGTQLFWPLEKRVELQSIFVIDPLYTLPFLFCLIAAMRLRRTDPRRRKWNLRGIYISTSYLLLTLVFQALAKREFISQLNRQQIDYEKVSVRPAPLNTILWNANIEVKDGYYLGEYSFFDTQPVSFRYFAKDVHLLGEMKEDRLVARLMKMSEGWYIITQQDGKTYFNDLRFGLLNNDGNNPEFVFRYELVRENGTVVGRETESAGRREPKKLLARLWKRMWGN